MAKHASTTSATESLETMIDEALTDTPGNVCNAQHRAGAKCIKTNFHNGPHARFNLATQTIVPFGRHRN